MSTLEKLIKQRQELEDKIAKLAHEKYKNGDMVRFKIGNMSTWGRLYVTGTREWHGRIDILGHNEVTGNMRKIPYIPGVTIHPDDA